MNDAYSAGQAVRGPAVVGPVIPELVSSAEAVANSFSGLDRRGAVYPALIDASLREQL